MTITVKHIRNRSKLFVGSAAAFLIGVELIVGITPFTLSVSLAEEPPRQTVRSPRDLAYYDVERLKKLSLADMKYKEVRRETIQSAVVPGKVTAIVGTYHGFQQPLALADGKTVTVPWKQWAVLCLPPAPKPGAAPVRHGLLYNCHDIGPDAALKQDVVRDWAVGLTRAFGIPVLFHGWEKDVVAAAGGESFGGTQEIMFNRWLAAGITRVEDQPMDGHYLYNGFPLAKADMVSITLLQRLAEKELSVRIEEVASLGASKEGHAQWVLGALDDRVAVLCPMSFFGESFRELGQRYCADWNGATPKGIESLFHATFRWMDWMEKTEAGATMDRTLSVEHWPDLIRARHVLVTGDIGRPPQHDSAWPLLAENKFLEKFRHPSWRYVRTYDDDGVGAGDMSRSVPAQAAELLVGGSPSPTTPVISAVEKARRISVTATSQLEPHLKTEARLLYLFSPSRKLPLYGDRWKDDAMIPVKGQPGKFTFDLPDVPPDHMATLLVVVRQLVKRNDITFWRSASGLPQEHFALPTHNAKLPSWKK